ncbi:MAG: hypothetical protein D6714_04625 [Bacteroidetes bacterium]|nr:MAG: hypothetical protein D6714_04625 [Bacteroidota bacterium]
MIKIVVVCLVLCASPGNYGFVKEHKVKIVYFLHKCQNITPPGECMIQFRRLTSRRRFLTG